MASIAQDKEKKGSNPYDHRITVTKVTPTAGDGTIKAFATIRLGSALEIAGVKVIQQTGQAPWVRLPDQKSGNAYYPIVKALDGRLNDAISEKVLAAWRDAVAFGVGEGAGRG